MFSPFSSRRPQQALNCYEVAEDALSVPRASSSWKTDTAVPLQPARGPCCEVTLRLLLSTTGVISNQGVEMREATPQLLR